MNSIDLAQVCRSHILKMCNKAKASHCGSCLSVIDILSVLYSNNSRLLRIRNNSDERDVVIISKGHVSAAYFAVLKESGIAPYLNLEEYMQNNQFMGGHITNNCPGIEFATGSLGHGLPYGVGVALSKKKLDLLGKVFVVMSDGELDEGTTWESLLIANQFNLDNLILIIDRNGLQSIKGTEETLKLEPLANKFESFGFLVKIIDGHNHNEINESINMNGSSPKVIIASTIKGKGVSFMENKVEWHYKYPNDQELILALKEVNIN